MNAFRPYASPLALSSTAAVIRTLHGEAMEHAQRAVARAVEVGRLLAEAKAALPHGEFQTWITHECGLIPRTAQRYLRAFTHRDALPSGLGLRAALEHVAKPKCVTVSHLPEWLPQDEAVTCDDDVGSHWFAWRVGDYAHAARLIDEAMVECTRKPIRADYIGEVLKHQGLPNPDGANWRTCPREIGEVWRDASMVGAPA